MSSSNQNSAPPAFTGEFCHKVEGKNRITVPSAWRFDKEVELFMIPKSLQTCIAVMTREELARLKADANNLDPAERSEFLHVLGSDLCQVTLDKGGRITIPEHFFDQLGLPEARQVWLSGSVDTFNLWSVADFEAQKAEGLARKHSLKRKLGI